MREHEDERLGKILGLKAPETLPDDFEERVMNKIQSLSENKSRNLRYLALSWFFFFIGLMAGILICTNEISIQGMFSEMVRYDTLIQVLILSLILVLFERLFVATTRKQS